MMRAPERDRIAAGIKMVPGVHAKADQRGVGLGEQAGDVPLRLDGRVAVGMEDEAEAEGVAAAASHAVDRGSKVGPGGGVKPSCRPDGPAVGGPVKVVKQDQEP